MTIRHLTFGLGQINTRAVSVDEPSGGSVKIDQKIPVSIISDSPIADGVFSNEPPAVTSTTPNLLRVTESKESSPGPFNTLFSNFKLKSQPIYNFYVEDEETNDIEDVNGRHLDEIPRFIRLKWNRPPLTEDRPKRQQEPPTTKGYRKSTYGSGPIKTDMKRGITFDRQKANRFSKVLKASANGFISPATISSIVELPASKAGLSMYDKSFVVDEMLYLKACCTEGVSIHDVQANINTNNGVLRAARVLTESRSKRLDGLKGDLFSGKYSITKAPQTITDAISLSTNTKGLSIQGIVPDSSVMQMDLVTADNTESRTGTNVDQIDMISAETVRDTTSQSDESRFTEVSFVDPAITGLVNEDKVNLLDAPEHAENTVAVSQFLPNLCTLSETESDVPRRKTIPSFPATVEELGTEYIGYVIEKYYQGLDGTFMKVEEIEVPDITKTEFVDSKILYGGVYRYRIKTIMKWTRPANIDSSGTIAVEPQVASQASQLAPYRSSYFMSEFNRKWQYSVVLDTKFPDPPDELVVRPESHKERIIVTWKVPNDPQRDLHYYRLFRKTKDAEGIDITEWELVDIIFGMRNVLYYDNDVALSQEVNTEYVYAVQVVTKHDEASQLSTQVSARLNPNFKYEGELPIKHVSSKGVNIHAIGAFETCPIQRKTRNIRVKNRFSLESRLGVHKEPLLSRSYCVRIESLDTAQSKDIIVSLEYRNLKPEIIVKRNLAQTEKTKSADNGLSIEGGTVKSSTKSKS